MEFKTGNAIIIIILLLGLNTFGQNNFPTNVDGSIVDTINTYINKNRIKELEGKFYAFDAKIIEVHKAHQGKPYYQVEFVNGNRIWIASLIKSGYEKEGKYLRILGILSEISEDDKIANKYNETKFHILLFALVDIESKQASMLPAAEEQGKEWMNGKIPDDLSN
jgi:hypothetical protein